MKIWTDEFGTIFAEPDCADEWLELIYDIGIGYDGMHTVKGLQELIDEMMEMTKKARVCLRERLIMNDDLISRSALLADIQTDVEDGGVSGMVAGALRRYVRRAPAVDAGPKWISVEERLPKEWESVLVRSRCGYTECAVWLGVLGKWRCTWDHTLLESEITHWMPLPEPPKEG